MKKQLLTIAATVVAVSAMAQGTFTFANSTTSLIKQQSGASDVSVPAANFGRVQFAWAPETATVTPWAGGSLAAWLAANPAVTLLPDVANVGVPVAGRFSGGEKSIASGPGAVVKAFVIGWAGAAAYTSFDAAIASGNAATRVGVSPAFLLDTANPNATPVPETSPVIAPPFAGLTLVAVPEPASFALLGLGAAGLLIFRRRS